MRIEDRRVSRDPRSSILNLQIPRQAENSEVAFDPHMFNGVDVAVMNPPDLRMVKVKFPLPGTVKV
jgi:hypothetical protein